MLPKCSFVCLTTCLISSGFVTSHLNASESTPFPFSFSLISSHASTFLEHTTIFAPASAYSSPIWAPSPRPPPLIIAVFAFSFHQSNTLIMIPPTFIIYFSIFLCTFSVPIWQFDDCAPHQDHLQSEVS